MKSAKFRIFSKSSAGLWAAVLVCLAWPMMLWAQGVTAPGAPAASGKGVVSDTIWGTFQQGGSIMWFILATSILGLMFTLECLLRLRQGAILPAKVELALGGHRRGHAGVAEVLAELKPDLPMARILKVGYDWRKGSNAEIQAAIEEAVDEVMWQLKRSVRPLGIIANTAPLLGLLGTVTGIIQAFDVVARQGSLGDPGALAGGISEALLTTGFGLIVAIPTLLAYHYFIGRVELLLRKCEIMAKENLILPPE